MKMTKFAAMALSFAILTAVPTQAATRSVTAGSGWKTAKTVKKGTSSVKLKSSTPGYVKFKATATRTYKFKFSKLRCSGSPQIVYAFAKFSTGKESSRIRFKQNGKMLDAAYLTTSYIWSKREDKAVNASTFIPSRTVSLKLNKGQTVVIRMYASSGNRRPYYNLTIK